MFSVSVFVIIYQKHKNILKYYYAYSMLKFDVKVSTRYVCPELLTLLGCGEHSDEFLSYAEG